MGSLVFLVEVAAFVLLARWAYRNDAIGMAESGVGWFAMRASEALKRQPQQRWKRTAHRNDARSPVRAAKGPAPRWNMALRRRDEPLD